MALVITTESSTNYQSDRANKIYPAYVDNTAYASWLNPLGVTNPSIASMSKPYFELKTSGGTATHWEILDGSLPKGMDFSPETGRIYGEPKKIGNYTFVAQASNDSSISEPKQLVFEAKPYRGRWLSDITYGNLTHWNKNNTPAELKNQIISGVVNTYITEFQAQTTGYNPTADAARDFAHGIKYREILYVWQDMMRMAPNNFATRFNDRATNDYFGGYIDAYHALGLKVGAYFAPNFEFNKIPGQSGSAAYNSTDGDIPFGNWAGPNRGFMEEAIVRGLDVALIDVGAASDYYVPGFANPGIYIWEWMVCVMRGINPDFCFAINPGTRTAGARMGGAQIRAPHADGYIFEATKSNSTSADLFEVGTPPLPRKKVFIYCWQMPAPTFGYGPDSNGAPLKEIEGTKQKMSECWENGCTFVAAHPVKSTGQYPDPYHQSHYDQMAAHATASGGYSSHVEIDYDKGYATFTAEPDEVIYYTTDGSRPGLTSNRHIGPIKIIEPTFFRVRAKHPNKLLGHVYEAHVGQEFEKLSTGRTLFKSAPNVVHAVDTGNFFRGMELSVFGKDIIVEAFGRQVSGTPRDREFIDRIRADEFYHYFGTLRADAPIENGFQWLYVENVRLKAGSTHWLGFKENTTDTYASNTMAVSPLMKDCRVGGNAIMSPQGDIVPNIPDMIWYSQFSSNYTTGQFINIKYRTVDSNESKDLLLGRSAAMFDNSNNPATTNAGVYFATNANNGLSHTFASVANIYPWTWRGEFEVPRKVGRVEVEFHSGYSTEVQLYGTMSGIPSSSTFIAQKLDNALTKLTFTFPPRFMKYLHVRSNKPNGASQPGGGMIITRVSAYQK